MGYCKKKSKFRFVTMWSIQGWWLEVPIYKLSFVSGFFCDFDFRLLVKT